MRSRKRLSIVIGLAIAVLWFASEVRTQTGPSTIEVHPCYAPEYQWPAWWGSVDSLGSGFGAIEGHVFSVSGEPLIGVIAEIPGLDRGAISDTTGFLELDSIPAGYHKLKIHLIGYGSQTHQIAVATGRTDSHCFALRKIFQDFAGLTVFGS
jgi:hypothetical protein